MSRHVRLIFCCNSIMADTDNIEHDCCELCARTGIVLTRHHLIPKMRHRNRRTRRDFSHNDRVARILMVCRPCHNHIHDVFTEKELAHHYNTREALLADERIDRFVRWIATKPAGYKPPHRAMRR